MTILLKTGDSIEITELLKNFVALQYRRNDQSFYRGTFRARGDTIDIFPAHYEDRAWRLSFFGNEIERINEFDPLTGESTGNLDSVTIYANSHYVTPRPTIQQAIQEIKGELKERLGSLEKDNKLLEIGRAHV